MSIDTKIILTNYNINLISINFHSIKCEFIDIHIYI